MKFSSLALSALHILNFSSLPPVQSFVPTKQSQRTSQLRYYKPNLPLSSRLSELQSEFSSIKSRGLDKFLLDEISNAQKRLNADAGEAEKSAGEIVRRGRAEEGKMMREVAKASEAGGEEMAVVLNGLKGVRQELEEARGIERLGGVVEGTVKNDLLLERDLQSVTEKVATSLKEAEVSIQSMATAMSAGETTDDNRDLLMKQLETTIKSLQQSLETSTTLATSAKKSSSESFSVLERIAATRKDLIDAMEDTEDTIGFIAEKGQGGDGLGESGRSLLEAVDNVGNVAFETVKQVEAVEKLANVLTTKVGAEADAILSLNAKTSDSVLDTLRAAKDLIKQPSSSPESTNLLMREYVERIKQQLEITKQLATTLQSDITTDKSSLDFLKTSNLKVAQLLDTAEHQVEMTKRAILTRESVDATYIEQNIADVKSVTLAVLDAAKASAEGVGEIKSAGAMVFAPVVEKVAGVGKEVKLEAKAEAEVKSDVSKPEEKIESKSVEAKQETEAVEPGQKDELKPAEPTSEPDAVKSESKTESKAEEEAKPEPDESHTKPKVESKSEVETSKPEPRDESKSVETKEEAKSEEKIEPKPSDVKEEAPSKAENDSVNNAHSEKAPKDEAPSKAEDNSANNAHSEETPKDAHESQGSEIESKPQSNHAADDIKELHGVSDSREAASTSESPAISDATDSTTKTVALAKDSAIESHSDLVAAHDASEVSSTSLDGLDLHASSSEIVREASDSLPATPLDVSDVHAASSQIVHELATAASNVVESVHDMVVATSFFL